MHVRDYYLNPPPVEMGTSKSPSPDDPYPHFSNPSKQPLKYAVHVPARGDDEMKWWLMDSFPDAEIRAQAWHGVAYACYPIRDESGMRTKWAKDPFAELWGVKAELLQARTDLEDARAELADAEEAISTLERILRENGHEELIPWTYETNND